MTFAAHFHLDKSQPELDFIDIRVNADLQLFVDPFAISQRLDRWSQECSTAIVTYFETLITLIRSHRRDQAYDLLRYLGEPNETRLGFCRRRPRGAGIGGLQAGQLLAALEASSAVRTGFIRSLEECELMVEGIGRDKISDVTTNIIRSYLADYTREQCLLHGVELQNVALPPYFSVESNSWVSNYFDLPVAANRPILLVPKAFARYDASYDQSEYYRHFVLNFLQAEHLNANSSLVHVLKNQRRVVRKKDIEAVFPLTKQNLYEFSRNHPEVLEQYRSYLVGLEERGYSGPVEPQEELTIAAALHQSLESIPRGSQDASEYHSLMVGIVEFLFFPNLLYPRKEQEIHEGRKRIDIVMENGARDGIFHRLHSVRGLPCAYVAIECKNYTTEIANPELDQISGRFGVNRGKLGLLCCRNFENRGLFVARCRDTLRDDRGLILPIDDNTVFRLLDLIGSGRRSEIEQVMLNLVAEVWLN